ncbi:hypothetical protein [Streptomyces sp. B6B3]|uniref:hypothetical protein n=1 Tax=Streptomyces sp. B6B3 TaxID=3153570 RepID=UPI00325E8FE6
MAEEHGETAARLAVVCAYLEDIRRDLRQGPGGDEAPVDRVLAAVRDGGDLTGVVDTTC